jgi:TonB family protein
MATLEQFGKYVLLKKLSEDPLGETFRAGRLGPQGVEQVVLLRAFNGPRIDTVRLAGELRQRTAVQEALKSPNNGNGVDLGEEQGVPFLAYDYVSGKNLAALAAQAERQLSPLPLDHALLIAERIGLALTMAYETKLQQQRVLHGFVVPQLVMISNEGETRLLGFEAGPVLWELAGRGVFEPEVAAYLAPEALSGSELSKADDVYSLGAILFELLTGTRPSGNPASLAEEIDRAVVAADGTPIPPPIAALLKKSLAPRDQRVPEAVTWHKALSKILVEGQYTATTFNLAFFMHNLFRAEIEKESRELEAEKEMPVPAAAEAAAGSAAAGAPHEDGESTGTLSDTSAVRQRYAAQASEGRSGKGLWVGLAAAVLLLAAAGGVWYFTRQGGGQGAPEPVAAAPAEPVAPEPEDLLPLPEEATEAEPAGPTPEEIQAQELQDQLQAMIDAQSREMEAKLKAQYDARIQELQTQLQATQEAAVKAREQAAEAAKAEPPKPAAQPGEAAEEEADQVAEARTPAGPSAPGEDRSQPDTAGGDTPGSGSTPTQAARPEARPATPRPTPPAPLVEPAGSAAKKPVPEQNAVEIDSPQLLRAPSPRYPDIAKRMNKEATVLLRVLVNEQGRVVDVERIGPKVGSGLDEAAMDAARQARYKAGTEDGKPKAMWTTLRIEFRL